MGTGTQNEQHVNSVDVWVVVVGPNWAMVRRVGAGCWCLLVNARSLFGRAIKVVLVFEAYDQHYEDGNVCLGSCKSSMSSTIKQWSLA
jgi:hypothetical protein